MAILRLELALDSEVYPELHAALASLADPASRAERLRQLAATGLVWETVRIHGASVARLGGSADAAGAAAPPPSVAAVRQAAEPARPRAERRAPAPTPRSDFIDLALNAPPATAPAPAGAAFDAAVRGVDLDVASQHLPMLFDVVAAPPPRAAVTPAAAASTAPLPTPAPADALPADPIAADRPLGPLFRTDLSEPVESADSPADDAGAPPDGATALAGRPAVRSRLLRMKEMGLFKNG